MSSATWVPETRLMSGEELSADDAWTTLRAYGRWPFVRDAFTRFRYADGFSHARALAFQFCMSFIPLVIAVVGLAHAVNQDKVAQVITQTLLRVSPGTTGDRVVQEAIQRTRERSETAGQLALWLGLLLALLALTTAMAQVERGANRIYGIERDRPTREKYGRAALLAVTAGIASMLGFLVLVAGGAVGESLAQVYGWGSGAQVGWTVARWPLGLLLALASYTVIFERAPRRNQPAYSWLAVGAGVALLLWLLFTIGLTFYVAKSTAFGSTYGPLTGVFALLLWANLTSLALFVGLAFAAQLEAVRAGVREPAQPDSPR